MDETMQNRLAQIRACITAAKAAPVYAPMQRIQHAEAAIDHAVELLAIIVQLLENRKK